MGSKFRNDHPAFRRPTIQQTASVEQNEYECFFFIITPLCTEFSQYTEPYFIAYVHTKTVHLDECYDTTRWPNNWKVLSEYLLSMSMLILYLD